MMKRTLNEDIFSASKRRAPDPYEDERICNLPDALDAFSDPRAAAKAKASGLLRNWGARDKWLEAEPLVLDAWASIDEGETLSDDDLLDMVPMLEAFEPETLEVMLAQSRRHGEYERAAAQLLKRQKERLNAAHDRQLRQMRLETESESTRVKADADARVAQAAKRKEEERKIILQAATDKTDAMQTKAEAALQEAVEEGEEALQAEVERREALQAKVAELEGEIAELNEAADEEAREAVRREEELHGRVKELEAECAACMDETDLKRETSRKLKEEVIDNDRLTLANLNRIKHLEAQLEQQAEELDALRNEHEQHKEQARDEVTSLQDLLVEREQLVQALSGRDGGRDGGGGVHRRMGGVGAMDEPLEPMRKHQPHQLPPQQQQKQFDDEREAAHDFGSIGSPLRERNHYLHENLGGAVHGSGGNRRDSLLDRIGAFGTKHFGSPGAMGGNVGSLI